MNITKQRLKEIIKEEINEISKKTEVDPGGINGIIKMANRASIAADNLETKILNVSKQAQTPLFSDGSTNDIPEELVIIQRYIDSIKKAAQWIGAASAVPTAMHQMEPSEYLRQKKRAHTPAYKRDEK